MKIVNIGMGLRVDHSPLPTQIRQGCISISILRQVGGANRSAFNTYLPLIERGTNLVFCCGNSCNKRRSEL